jgi:hypothetical protein
MNDQANKILVELLQKATNGIDAAVSFSQAQIPDVVHQLLVWSFVHSFILTVLVLASIFPVMWFIRIQLRKVEIGKFTDEGYSWDRGKPKFSPTLIWNSRGGFSEAMLPLSACTIGYVFLLVEVLTNATWLKIWLAPKLYLLEYATSLVK